jgi:hypothetical protein
MYNPGTHATFGTRYRTKTNKTKRENYKYKQYEPHWGMNPGAREG